VLLLLHRTATAHTNRLTDQNVMRRGHPSFVVCLRGLTLGARAGFTV